MKPKGISQVMANEEELAYVPNQGPTLVYNVLKRCQP